MLILTWSKGLAQDTKRADWHLQQALKWKQAKNYEAFKQDLDAAIRLSPNHCASLHHLGDYYRYYQTQPNPDLALSYYRKALDCGEYAEKKGTYHSMGRIYLYDRKEPEKAYVVLQTGLPSNKEDKVYQYDLGFALAQMGEESRSQETYLRSIRLEGKLFGPNYREFAHFYREKELHRESVQLYEKTVDADGFSDKSAYAHLAWTYWELGKKVEAFKALASAFEYVNAKSETKADSWDWAYTDWTFLQETWKVYAQEYFSTDSLKDQNGCNYIRQLAQAGDVVANDYFENYCAKLTSDADLAKATRLNSEGLALKREGKLYAAIRKYSEALKLVPSYTSAYNNRGNAKHGVGDYKAALVDFNKAIELNPNDDIAYHNRGRTREQLKDYEGAMQDYEMAIERAEDYAGPLNSRAALQINVFKEYEDAIFVLDEVIEIAPNFGLAFSNRGSAKYLMGDIENACVDFKRACELGSNEGCENKKNNCPLEVFNEMKINASKLIDEGEALYEEEKYQEAIAKYNEALKLDPYSYAAYAGRGQAKDDFGDHKGAVADFTQAIQLNPDEATIYINRGVAKSKLNNFEGEILDYTKAIAINPDDPNAHYNRGNAKYLLKDYDGAIADLTQAIQLRPDDATAYINRGLVKRELKDYDEAIADYTKAIAISPDSFDAHLSRGNTKYILKDYEGAIADLTQAIQLNPNDAIVYVNRGIAKHELNDYVGAISDYTKAIQLHPDNAVAYDIRGGAKYMLKDYEGAMADYSKAIELNPDNASAYNNRGFAQHQLNYLTGGCVDFQTACKLGNKAACDNLKDNCEGW